MSDDLPYIAEYAKSGRATCKGCKSSIEKNSLRLAVMVQSPMFDGKTPHWYHYMCFFGRQRPKSVGDISHFESLRWEDQEKIKAKIDGGVAAAAGGAGGKDKPKSKGKKRGAATGNSVALKDFTVEYAKSSRSTCRGCEEKIMKDEVRISKKDFESENAKMYGGQERWHHVECFAKLRDELEFWESGDCLPGIKSLKKEDQQLVKNKLPKVEKKENADAVDDGPSPSKEMKVSSDDSKIRAQNEQIYKYRDHLKKDIKKKNLQWLLEYNDQDVPVGSDKILDHLADIMTFGSLERCEECKGGQFVFRSFVGYQCLGDLTEWTKCQNKTLEPKRKPFKIPPEFPSDHVFLQKYKYVARKRIVQLHTPSAAPTISGTSNSKYWLFRSWGRIGTTIGGKKLEEVQTLKNALEIFESMYEEKTGNMWFDRNNFQKVPGRFYPVDLDYTQEDDETLLQAGSSSITCKRLPPIQELVQLVFDVNLMKQVMLEFELDLEKMPLGKLSKKQIQQAYSVLTDLQELIKNGGSDTH